MVLLYNDNNRKKLLHRMCTHTKFKEQICPNGKGAQHSAKKHKLKRIYEYMKKYNKNTTLMKHHNHYNDQKMVHNMNLSHLNSGKFFRSFRVALPITQVLCKKIKQ
jgi:hypothetical protein